MTPLPLHQVACTLVLLATLYASAANNDAGSQAVVPTFVREPRDTFVALTRRAVLSCQVAQFSFSTSSKLLVRLKDTQRVSFVWLLNGSLIATSRQKDYSVTNSLDQSTLTVLNFRSLHQGRYQCVANFTYGSIISRPAFLRQPIAVLSAEQSIEENTISMTVGNTAFISCTSPFSVSVPKAEVVGFELNGAPLALTPRHLVTSDGNLVIAAVQQADQGSYRCKLANVPMNLTRLSRNVNALRVIDPKREKDGPAPRNYALKTPQSSVATVVGQNVTIECVFVGMPPPRTVWEFAPQGESQRQVSQSADGRISVISGVLQITNVQAEDEGLYSCSSIDSRSVPHYAQLRVSKPPYFESEAASYQLTTAKAGGRVELDCGASEATRWTWYHDGAVLPSGQSSNKHVLSAMTVQSSGVYQCLAENAHGSAFKTIRLTVTSNSRNAYQIVQLPNNRSVSVDELAVFACVASGNLKEGVPSWSWLKDGRALPNDSRILVETQNELTTSLQIYNVKQTDAGSYSCVLLDASGAAKNSRATAWLTVEAQVATTTSTNQRFTQQSTSQRRSKAPKRRPTTSPARSASPLESARTEIYIAVLNSTSLSVSWTHAEPVTMWLYGTAVWYRAVNSTDAQNERKFVTSEVTQYILTNLLPDTEYKVWVVAQQQNGDKASPSDSIVVRTLADERNSLDDGSSLPQYDDELSNEEDGQTMDIDVEELIRDPERFNAQVGVNEQLSEHSTASALHNAPQNSGQLDASSVEPLDDSGNSRLLYILLVSLVCAALLLVGSTLAFLFLRARARGYSKASAKNKESSAKSPSAHSRVSDDNSILSYTRLPQTALTVNTSPACVNVNVGMISETMDGDLHGDVDADGSFVLHATLARDGTLRTGSSNVPIGYIPMGSALNALSFVTTRDACGAEQQHATSARAGVFVSNFGDRYESATCGPPKRTSIVLASPNGAFSSLETGGQVPVFGHVAANGYRTLLPTVPLNAAHPLNIATFLSNIRPPSVASSQRLNAPTGVAQRRSTGQLTGSSSSLSNASCSDCQCSHEDVNCNRECHHAWSKSARLEAGQTGQHTAGQSSTLMRKRKHAKYRSARRKSTNQKEPSVTLKLDFPNNGALTTNLNLA